MLGACRGNPDRARRSAAGPDARRDEGARGAAVAGREAGPSGEYSAYSTDEQRRRRVGGDELRSATSSAGGLEPSQGSKHDRRPGSARHATWSGYRDRLLAAGARAAVDTGI